MMNQTKIYTALIAVLFILAGAGCEKQLTEEPYSQLVPDNFLTTKDGLQSVLYAAYTEEGAMSGQASVKGFIAIPEMCTDLLWQTSGSDNRVCAQIINFSWDPSTQWFFSMLWRRPYLAIRDANAVLDNLDRVEDISDEEKTAYAAEARFIRAISYYHLYLFFGPVPLRKSSQDSLQLSRATEEQMRSFIESELTDVAGLLPDPGKEAAYGRANKGAAMAFLCKYYLNTKQWQKCADMARQIIDLQDYALYPDYFGLFQAANERNKEFIWVRQASVLGPGNVFMSSYYPPDFQQDPKTGLTFMGRNFGAQYRLLDGFYNSFDPEDKRLELILTEYINSKGKTISLLDADNTRSFKYWPDPNQEANNNGNDIPEIRYADILLSRAEALNELQGPNQASIDLINQIRHRAGLTDIALADYGSKAQLRQHILAERGWEFYSEGKRRQDLLRMGQFINNAQVRGKAAKDFHKLFPIPQQAMDSNPRLQQNPGY